MNKRQNSLNGGLNTLISLTWWSRKKICYFTRPLASYWWNQWKGSAIWWKSRRRRRASKTRWRRKRAFKPRRWRFLQITSDSIYFLTIYLNKFYNKFFFIIVLVFFWVRHICLGQMYLGALEGYLDNVNSQRLPFSGYFLNIHLTNIINYKFWIILINFQKNYYIIN